MAKTRAAADALDLSVLLELYLLFLTVYVLKAKPCYSLTG